jgi:hypothetical protein
MHKEVWLTMKRLFALVSFLLLLVWLSGCTQNQAQGMEPTTSVPITQLTILRISPKDQPILAAHIFSVATNERLYSSLLDLPPVPSSTLTSPTSPPEYQLAFKLASDVPALIYSKESLIRFDNNYWYSITDQFEKVFKEILAQATFSPT